MPVANSNSLRKDTIINWWESFEQEIIKLSSEYNVMGVTDITNCYSSIYTHTIFWALHDKEYAKANKKDRRLLGNIIDNDIGLMQCGQTNGLPEGSEISDDIAEKFDYDQDSALNLVKGLYQVCCGEEPDYVIKRLNLKDTVGIPAETILKVYKWIWGQEDCNYPTKAGRWLSMNAILDKYNIDIDNLKL